MQRHIQQDLARKRRRNLFLGGILVILLVLLGLRLASNLSTPSEITATSLHIPSSYEITPFGKYVLYYDGMSLHCVTTTGGARWTVPLGSDAGFHTDGKSIVAWSGTQIYVINANGVSTHSDNLRSTIQFAKIGNAFVGIVIGEETTPHLYIIDLDGNPIDQEVNAYDGYALLNIGFFGEGGKYMWTLSFDIHGSMPDYILNTFQVGQKNTGNLSLGDAAIYSILYDNENLKVASTRQLRTFDYRGTEDLQKVSLIYGWHMVDSHLPSKGTLSMLFAPASQTTTDYQIGELRLISGTSDTRYTLPSSCIGATIINKSIYAFSSEYIYRAESNAQHFSSLSLPDNLPAAPSAFFGVTTEKEALVDVSGTVYAIKLP